MMRDEVESAWNAEAETFVQEILERHSFRSWDEIRPWFCEAAAAEGRLKCLIWAHNNDCPFTDETCARAAFGGHLEVSRAPTTEGLRATGFSEDRVKVHPMVSELYDSIDNDVG